MQNNSQAYRLHATSTFLALLKLLGHDELLLRCTYCCAYSRNVRHVKYVKRKHFWVFSYLLIEMLYDQGTHSNFIFKFPVFSLSDRKFSLPIYVICDYYIHKTDLADVSTFKNKLEIFRNFRGKKRNIFYL